MAEPCRYSWLVDVLAALDRTTPEPTLDCPEPATYSTPVVRKRPGQEVEVWTALCDVHDEAAQGLPGYGNRSVKLARPRVSPAM